MKQITTYIIVMLILVTSFVACNNNVIYSSNKTLPIAGWHKDSVLTYTFNIADTVSTYNLILNVRHTQQYRYQNLWFFLDYYMPDMPIAQRDTIEFYLADDMGRWLGNGFGNMREMPVLIGQNVAFKSSGDYTLVVEQAMRDTLLLGVSDVGLMIEKTELYGKE